MLKTGANTLKHLRQLPSQRRRLVGEAVVSLLLVSGALRLLPFRRAIRIGSVDLGPRQHAAIAEDVVWAIEAAARRLPWRTVCLHKGLAAQWMLRRAGMDALLNYGIRKEEAATGKLAAHVWVTVGGRAVIGGEEAAGFARVASYPQSAAAAG